MNWTGIIAGAGAALIIIGVPWALLKAAGLIAAAIGNKDYSVRFYGEYTAILAGCLMIGGTIGT